MKQRPESSTQLRDEIALSAAAAVPYLNLRNEPEKVAETLYRFADAMLAQKAKGRPIT